MSKYTEGYPLAWEARGIHELGVIYATAGQIMDDELFSNEKGSENFTNFLTLLGDRVTLKGWQKFRGGLDIRGNMTGQDSMYTTHEEHEIMFHVSTMLPFFVHHSQKVRLNSLYSFFDSLYNNWIYWI